MYYRQIDGIRAFAVFGPIMVHLWPHNVPDTPYTGALAHLGSLGVMLFFVISGFLITGILFRSKDRVERREISVPKSLAIFYIRRSIRIFPIYYLLLMVLFLLGMGELRSHGGWYFAYLANFRFMEIGQWPIGLAHVWSLSVEEQFYLVWPLLVLTVSRRWTPWLFLSLFMAAPVLRILLINMNASPFVVSISPFTCLDPLAAGALLALWLRSGQPFGGYRMLRMIGIISALGLLAQAFYYVAVLHGGSRSYQLPLMRTCSAIFFAWIVGAAALERTWKFKAVLLAKPIVYIGRISYGIYLYHLVIPWVLARVFNIHFGRTVGAFLIISALTVLIASLSWLLIETPMNRLKRLAPS